MFDEIYKNIQMKLTYTLIYILQTSFVKYIIHTYKYVTNTLYIGDYSADEFKHTWKIVCMKKCPSNSVYYYTIDPTTPLETISEDVVYTLRNSSGDIRYFPVFADEISKMYKIDNITLYTVLRWRINRQIPDCDDISDMFKNLFDEDDQYFIPYMKDNNYMKSLLHMYDVEAIY